MAGWAAFTKYRRRKLHNIILHMHVLACKLCTRDGWGEVGYRDGYKENGRGSERETPFTERVRRRRAEAAREGAREWERERE